MNSSHVRQKARLPKIQIDKSLVGRLENLAASMMRRSPDVAERLMDELSRAKLVASEKLRPDVVTIGSTVTYRDCSSHREHTVVLVYPEDEDIGVGRISVTTPVGVALLGLGAGSEISWVTREGVARVLEVIQVLSPNEK